MQGAWCWEVAKSSMSGSVGNRKRERDSGLAMIFETSKSPSGGVQPNLGSACDCLPKGFLNKAALKTVLTWQGPAGMGYSERDFAVLEQLAGSFLSHVVDSLGGF